MAEDSFIENAQKKNFWELLAKIIWQKIYIFTYVFFTQLLSNHNVFTSALIDTSFPLKNLRKKHKQQHDQWNETSDRLLTTVTVSCRAACHRAARLTDQSQMSTWQPWDKPTCWQSCGMRAISGPFEHEEMRSEILQVLLNVINVDKSLSPL